MGSLSPIERADLINNSKHHSIMEELAKRIGPLGGLADAPKDKAGEIDYKNADETFHSFKKKFRATTSTQETASKINDSSDNTQKL